MSKTKCVLKLSESTLIHSSSTNSLTHTPKIFGRNSTLEISQLLEQNRTLTIAVGKPPHTTLISSDNDLVCHLGTKCHSEGNYSSNVKWPTVYLCDKKATAFLAKRSQENGPNWRHNILSNKVLNHRVHSNKSSSKFRIWSDARSPFRSVASTAVFVNIS